MTSALRLFWIESRRSIAIWLLPVALIAIWFIARESHAHGVTLWAKKSAQSGQALIVLGPLSGGLAAWVAARDRRRGIEDLLTTTPRSRAQRDLLGYASTAALAACVYLVAVATVFVVTATEATWGGPDLLPVWLGLATIALSVAVGYAAGLWAPSRFTPALVPVALLLALLIPVNLDRAVTINGQRVYQQSTARYLTPWTYVDPGDYDPFRESWPAVGVSLAFWMLGLIAIGVLAITLRRNRKPLAWGALLVALVGSGLAGSAVRGTETDGFVGETHVKFEPVCQHDAITVCMHPAYEPLLGDVAELVDGLVGPVAGLPGVPTRIEQQLIAREESADGTLHYHFYNWIYNGDWGRSIDAESIVGRIVCETSCHHNADSDYSYGTLAPSVVGGWMLSQAGIEPSWIPPPRPGQERAREQVDDALRRFAALDQVERRAWFEQHFADLRAGRLSIEDLP